jgi:WD40 repeat protein/tRNA A-37 threonylcarbamoyl transferase component Bud32
VHSSFEGDHTRSSAPHATAPGPRGAAALEPRAYVQARDAERYQIVAEHGRGGIGRVSRAYDRDLGRHVAIKELIAGGGHLSEMRFLREALITARLEHPSIVPVHEAGRWHDGTPFYAMKLVAGRSLRALIAERATVDDRIALLHHVIAVADAIAYAHRCHIIHRDLKPANVIVGEFGETVVIDWGLAKDLTTQDEPSIDTQPIRTQHAADLTTTGSVLGTPAYMAPEQARGEHVDQRADVYAIGAMLWELCTVERTLAADSRTRHRVLRRAGIDRDLISIIDKAVAPDPVDRYRNAGELAADLKAFKAGARIAARSYSLFALLNHWTRRHRTLALSIATFVGLAIAGGGLYVRDITAARDRADASQHGEQQARATAETALDALTLKHAQLLLTTDPSAALDELAAYHGGDTLRAHQIAAEATGRGTALLRATPHHDNVRWAAVVPSATGEAFGAVVSLSADGTIARTTRDGRSRVLARGVAHSGRSAYSRARHLLAYVCDPDDVCLLDAATGAPIASAPALRGLAAARVALSPSGNLLAVMAKTSQLTVLDVRDPAAPQVQLARPVALGDDVMFIDEQTIAAGTAEGAEVVPLTGAPARFAIADSSYWDADAGSHRLAISSVRGNVILIARPPNGAAAITARAELCHGQTSGLQLIPGRTEIAYACKDGTLGLWAPDAGTVTPRLRLEGHADILAVSPRGDYLVVTGGNASVSVLDLVTDLVATYKGHDIRPTAVTAPTDEAPFVISGDARGALRVWPLPPRIAKVAATVRAPLHHAVFDPTATTVIATSYLPSLTTYSPATGAHQVGPHVDANVFIARSTDGKHLATYGLNNLIELWTTEPMARTRVIPTHHGSLSQLAFVPESDDFLTAGNDGQLVRWTVTGDTEPTPAVLAVLRTPIAAFAIAPDTQSVVLTDRDGSLWLAALRPTADTAPTLLRRGVARVAHMIAWPDRASVYCGLANGDVIAVDTRDHRVAPVMHALGAVRAISVTPDMTTLVVATDHDSVHVGTRRTANDGWTWRPLELRVTHHALAADGTLVALCADGTVWMYAAATSRWLCLPVGTVDLLSVAINAPGDTATSLDLEGRLIWIDLQGARQLLAGKPPPL